MNRLSIFFIFLFISSAFAEMQPRDEAMVRANRCAGQPSTHIWLDCYYGSAQSVRSALGMSSAPSAQIQLSDIILTKNLPPDYAERKTVIAEAAHCTDIMDDRLWLNCFYKASNSVRISLGLTPLISSNSVADKASTQSLIPRQKKGFLSNIFDSHPIKVTSHMRGYSFDARGKFTVVLENGQRWRQLDGDIEIAQWRKPAENYSVKITIGAFKSHNFTVKGNPRMFKVQRIN